MTEHRLYVHGPTHEPFNPHALDEAQALVDFPPDGALQAWYGAPAATALQRYRDGEVTVRTVPQPLYYDPEKRWFVHFLRPLPLVVPLTDSLSLAQDVEAGHSQDQ